MNTIWLFYIKLFIIKTSVTKRYYLYKKDFNKSIKVYEKLNFYCYYGNHLKGVYFVKTVRFTGR